MSLIYCCRDATALLTEASEGALTGATAATFAFHLTICPHCRKYRAQLDKTVEVLRALPPAEPAKPKSADIDAIVARIAKGDLPED